MDFYKRYPGDYARDTAHLSLAEHGAYTVLLDIYYGSENPPPATAAAIYRLCRCCDDAERAAVDSVVAQFFVSDGQTIRHKRVDDELNKANELRRLNKIKGQHGGQRTATIRAAAKAPAVAGAAADGAAGGVANQTTRLPDSKTPSPSPSGEGVAAPPTPSKNGLPDCPHEKIIALYHQHLPMCPHVESWGDTRRGYLRARWREKAEPYNRHPGYKTLEEGLAYWERLFKFVSQSKFLTGRAEASGGRPPFVADLEWLVRPTNFAKVIEGKYP